MLSICYKHYIKIILMIINLHGTVYTDLWLFTDSFKGAEYIINPLYTVDTWSEIQNREVRLLADCQTIP